jgi:hypothetical protein
MGGWGAWNLALLILKCSPLCAYRRFVDRVPMIENCKIATIPIKIFTV